MDVGAIPEPVWGKEDMIFTENSTSCIETPKFIPHRSEVSHQYIKKVVYVFTAVFLPSCPSIKT